MRLPWIAVLVASIVPGLALAAPGTGRAAVFDLKSDPPGAEVWVDGTRKATTPCLLRLSPGSRLVELRKNGRKSRRLAVWAAGGSRIVRDAYEMAPEAAADVRTRAVPAGPRKWALLAGVNDYADPAIGDLRGCCNDVRQMQRVLTERYGFPEANVRTLLDRDATKQRILSEITDWLAKECRPGDVALFFFSGHGRAVRLPIQRGGAIPGAVSAVRLNDPLPTPADLARIEIVAVRANDTIVTADAVKAEPAGDLRDDELAEAIARVCAGRVVLILDSHHGKDGDPRGGFGVRLKARLDPAGTPFIYLAACRPGQVAQEREFKLQDGKSHYFGAFTYLLADVLSQADPGDAAWSYRRVMAEVAGKLKEQGFQQEPFLAGDGTAALFAP